MALACASRYYILLNHLRKGMRSKLSYCDTQQSAGSSSLLLSMIQKSSTRHMSGFRKPGPRPPKQAIGGEKTGFYMASVAVAMFGASFAAVPLYQLYCQKTGKPGQAFKEEENKIVDMKIDKSRTISVRFDANTHSSMDWKFQPLQDRIKVHPGETALAFYRATNPLDELVIGVATYTVLPYEAGQYFNKIQCFCFEEQMLRPHEDVFMPVLFYIDPEFSKDPLLAAEETEVVLSYTFFRSKDGEILELDEPIELKKHK